jgi:hypothetical protein
LEDTGVCRFRLHARHGLVLRHQGSVQPDQFRIGAWLRFERQRRFYGPGNVPQRGPGEDDGVTGLEP